MGNELSRKYNIKEKTTETYYPQHNPSDVITYNQLMDALNRGERDDNQYWTFQKFAGHNKDPEHPGNGK